MVWVPVPTALGVYVTEQLAEAPLPLNVQGLPVKLPVPLVLQLTEPVGVLAVPASLSLTVAEQVVAAGEPLRVSELGMQLTVVLVARLLTVRVAVPLLVLCVASPP